MDIDVLILVGGQGSRLKSVVNDRPKPMADINGKPFLDLLIEYAVSFGYNRFVLCAGHKAEFLKDYYTMHDSHCEVILSIEDVPLGTAGAIKNAEKYIRTDNVLVMNGDSFCPVDLQAFKKFHLEKHALLSMAVTKSDDSKDYGSINLDKSQKIISFKEKKKFFKESYINAGIYLFKRSVLDLIPSARKYSLEEELFPSVICDRFFGYIFDGELIDIGTPERYKLAKKILAL